MIRRVFLASVCGIVLSFGCGDDESTAPAETGGLQVILAMAGTDLDPDGCEVTVDGASPRLLLSGERTTYSGLEAGVHVVALSDVAENCAVQGGASRNVQVAANATVDVTLAVVCSSLPTGSVAVTTVTTGQAIPPDDFVAVVGEQFASIGVNATVTFDDIPVGQRSVGLTDLPLHCSVSGENPRVVEVQPAVTTGTTFNVSCPAHVGDRIAFTAGVEENPGDPPPPYIFVMTDQGAEIEQLTFAPLTGQHPDISPDGTRILFHHVRPGDLLDIYVMNADGSGATTLAAGEWADAHPAWSPDGTQIAFQSDRDGGPTAVWIMDSDGSNVRKLTSFPSWTPAWSPDATRIVFAGRDDAGEADLFIINVDGTGLTNITPDAVGDNAPAWSPDGQTIAFTSSERDGNIFQDIYIVSVNGGPITNLTNNPNFHDTNPDWSPDGSRIAFSSSRDGGFPDIYVMDSQGGNVTRLTVDLEAVFPDWGPLN
ncbi:MAG: hypothetical protein M8861_00685 [marine benthic group bacterium]|nr:hypothetical protein [Gemmatimonadota bacterium]